MGDILYFSGFSGKMLKSFNVENCGYSQGAVVIVWLCGGGTVRGWVLMTVARDEKEEKTVKQLTRPAENQPTFEY